MIKEKIIRRFARKKDVPRRHAEYLGQDMPVVSTTRAPLATDTQRTHPRLVRTHRPHVVDLVPSSPAPKTPWSPEQSLVIKSRRLGRLKFGRGSLVNRPIVLEQGSSTIRVGWAGHNKPNLAIPSLVGQMRPRFVQNEEDRKKYYLGADVLRKHRILQAQHPIERGMVKNFDQLEVLWEHCFSSLLGDNDLSDLSNHRILISSRHLAPFSDGTDERAMLAELALETFGFKACYIALPAALCLYPGGILTATVVDSGEGTTQVVPVYDGCYMRHAVTHLDIGGRDLTTSLAVSLQSEHKYEMRNEADVVALRKIKEGLCYVSSNYGKKLDAYIHGTQRSKTYAVPGIGQVTMGSARFQCAEALFTPQLLGKSDHGLARSVVDSIGKCDRSLAKTMFRNIILAGGSSLFTGFEKRIQSDIEALAPETLVKCRLAVKDNRQMVNAAWLGGSILAADSNFGKICLTREEAQEWGYHALHKYF